MNRFDQLIRMRRAPVAASIAMVLLAASCSGGGDSPSEPVETSSAPASTGWSFTDDRQVTVTLDEVPTRIVAHEDSAAALWSFGIRPIATFGNAPLADNPNFVGEDISGIESIGEEYGVIDLEKLAALDPDLLVTTVWPTQGASSDGGWATAEQEDLVSQIAPFVSIAANVPYTTIIDRFGDLAESLGADMAAPEVAATQQALDDSLSSLRSAVESNPKLRVLAGGGYDGAGFFVANPPYYSDLMVYKSLGLDLIYPPLENVAGFDGYWEELSWENVDTYEADIILLDERPFGIPADELADTQPTFARLPAVEAGQTGTWFVGTVYSIPVFTQLTEDLAALVSSAEPV